MQDTDDLGQLLKSLLQELGEEFGAILKGRKAEELSQSERRLYVRSIFALIEAVIYVMKQIALAAHPDVKCPTITEAERAFAQEQEYKLMSSGEVKVHRSKIPFEANIRFSFKLLEKACSVPSGLDVSGASWQALQRATKVRDRITHPKSVFDLNVLDEELKDVSAACGWLLISFMNLGTEVISISKTTNIN